MFITLYAHYVVMVNICKLLYLNKFFENLTKEAGIMITFISDHNIIISAPISYDKPPNFDNDIMAFGFDKLSNIRHFMLQ